MERGAHGTGGDELNAVIAGTVVFVGVAGKHGIDSVALEQFQVFLALGDGEVEVVFFFVYAFTEDGAVREEESVAGAAGCFKLLFEPLELLCFLLGDAVLDAAAVESYECAAFDSLGEAVVAVEFEEGFVVFFGPGTDVVVAGEFEEPGAFTDGGDVALVDGFLEGVGGVVDEVAGDYDCGGFEPMDGVHGQFHQGIGLGVAGGGVEETDLRVGHLDECELLRRAGGKAESHEGK